ncbi:TDP-N-acetylfucosamine:lipid II N-acetylfucosaminyltransferase [Oceanimonas doudoroffii]|uniref:4-alpha-L-fucosyltransferase (Fuc4NAc transferase) n=1 Tax=Oceanimonas doudoroffii TaxID=84158 RepID=A0A233RER1_9GAMM|nr:TDP-N-acetylfucosamine:lipid II N-acetylfucosaminyltransferase [Oceanimonas doudoroffii]OXY81881.1 4-alpha-L-fucosyltransferase (Fuc4NAc transferase) [Oceanimonas doudoroffii]
MKILHIATDDKFVDHAYTVFEKAFPEKNEVIIFSKSESLKFVKLKDYLHVKYTPSQIRRPRVEKELYEKYDLVIFHSFGDLLYPEIFNIPEDVPTVWFGWGYDYYDLIGKPKDLFLPASQNIASQSYKSLLRRTIGKILRFSFRLAGVSKSRRKAIEKLSIFSPVLPNEYEMVLNSHRWQDFPKYACWNYGAMEDHLIKGFEDEQVEGDSILIGNSASLTCNHKEILDFLHEAGVENRYIISPLSYGDKTYGEKIITIGKQYFGEKFNPLKDFMSIQNYVATIRKCGYVIMNHKRQQAVGNIVIMLYLGARVFLREENPTYPFLKEMGIAVSSVQELEKDISLLQKPLSSEEKENNKELVSKYWSREQGIFRTKNLVEQALRLADKNGCELKGGLV